MTGIDLNHGLSLITDQTNTDQRLALPLPSGHSVTNRFNDTGSAALYHPDLSAHNGLDWDCDEDTKVYAMFNGTVEKVHRFNTGLLGVFIQIKSVMDDSETPPGFQHTYGHLLYKAANPAEGEKEKVGIGKKVQLEAGLPKRDENNTFIYTTTDLVKGDPVFKGQILGWSGNSGTNTTGAHLHVQLRPYVAGGGVSYADCPDDPVLINGFMNFECFLPPSSDIPAITSTAHPLLGLKDTKDVPVCLDDEEQTVLGTLPGGGIGCYAILGKDAAQDPAWLQIQFTKNQTGWVPVKGRVGLWYKKNEEWSTKHALGEVVQIHGDLDSVPVRQPSVLLRPKLKNPGTNVRRTPSTDLLPLGTLKANTWYTIQVTYRHPVRDDNNEDTHHPWMGIPWVNEDGASQMGWVRDDVVANKQGNTANLPKYTGPADNPHLQVLPKPHDSPVPTIGTPRILSATSTGTSVTLTWSAVTVSGESPDSVRQATTYRIRWSENPDALKDRAAILSPETVSQVHVRETAGAATTATWTPDIDKGKMIHVRVAAYVGQFTGPASDPTKVVVGQGSLADYTFAAADRGEEPIRAVDSTTSPICDRLPSGFWRVIHAVLPDWLQVPCEEDDTAEAQASGTQSASQTAAQDRGWVRRSQVLVEGRPLPEASQTVVRVQYLRLRSWVTGLNLRTGPSTAFAAYRLLTDTAVWYKVTGQTNTTPVWYRLRYSDTFQGWVHGDYVTLSERTTVTPIPVSTPPPTPAAPEPTNQAGTGMETTTGSASGDFRNLVTNPDGRWVVDKSGATVTANFGSPRSPVQYYARQDPQPQFVLPAGFRPTATVTRTVTGSQVDENRKLVPNAPRVSFDLTIGTNGEMRYVNNSKVDHLGYVGYNVTGLTWQSNETLTVPAAPTQPGDIEASGVYLNQQENWGSSWELERRGNAVSGSFGSTRSPVQYYANGSTREAQLLLPEDYRPRANARFQVKGAVRVNEDGSDSTDTRKVDFWLTMQPNGEMWYDSDSNLQTLGVGYLRYTVNVSWTASPRITVPGIPRALEAEDIEATELELDWRRPAEDGGASVDGYRIQV